MQSGFEPSEIWASFVPSGWVCFRSALLWGRHFRILAELRGCFLGPLPPDWAAPEVSPQASLRARPSVTAFSRLFGLPVAHADASKGRASPSVGLDCRPPLSSGCSAPVPAALLVLQCHPMDFSFPQTFLFVLRKKCDKSSSVLSGSKRLFSLDFWAYCVKSLTQESFSAINTPPGYHGPLTLSVHLYFSVRFSRISWAGLYISGICQADTVSLKKQQQQKMKIFCQKLPLLSFSAPLSCVLLRTLLLIIAL